MWFPLVCVIEMRAGLRCGGGRERMRARSAVPRFQAVVAVKEESTAEEDSS